MEVRECVSKCLLIMIKMIRTFAAWPSRWAALLLFISHACAAGLFCTGFLLTRIELPERTSPLKSIPEAPLSEAPVHKTVWMIIDALRWDFVNHASSHDVQQSMPIMHILQDTCAAAVSLRSAARAMH